MKVIVGLGNPGIEYQFTPHNIGFLAIDRIADRCGVTVSNRNCKAVTARARIAGEEIVLAKPETYMNLSGQSVRELMEKYEADPKRDLLVLYDDLDLPLGTMRIRERGSSGGHNGIKSILGALGSEEWVRVRMGIAPDHRISDAARFVLSQWKKSQLTVVDEVLDKAADAVELILKEGTAPAMNLYNRKPETGEAEAGKQDSK